MKTIRLKAYVHLMHRSEWTPPDAPPILSLFSFSNPMPGFSFVGPVEFDYELPAGWNATAAEVAALEAEKLKALDAYHATVRTINERLAKLQAITNDTANDAAGDIPGDGGGASYGGTV